MEKFPFSFLFSVGTIKLQLIYFLVAWTTFGDNEEQTMLGTVRRRFNENKPKMAYSRDAFTRE